MASVTVAVYVPAISPEMLAVVAPLLQEYVYGAVPPVVVALAVPSAAPKHVASVLVQVADSDPAG